MPRLFAWLLLSLVLPLTACAQAPSGPVQAGRDYEVLPQGQRWQPADGRIEVAEVFGYWGHHCADFQPMVDAWKRKQAADVAFAYVPVAFDLDDSYALAYFAAGIIILFNAQELKNRLAGMNKISLAHQAQLI